MEQSVKKNEFMNQLNWLFLGLSGEQVLRITNLDNPNDVALFTWTAFVNDRIKTDQILNKIKSMTNVEINLETHAKMGILRRRCSYKNEIVKNLSFNQEDHTNVTDIDLIVNWSEM